MGYIRSYTKDNFQALDGPSENTRYVHPAESRRGAIPMAFQVTSPFDSKLALLPHALVLHINPASFSERHTKKIERLQTRGGWVEQHWGDDLSEISCDGSTGAFVNLYTGLSSVVRQKTIAWDRYRDLYDLYRNNGSVYDPFGNIVLQGKIQLLYDRGAYIGTFRSFDVEETADAPFIFKLSWTFKVEQIVVRVPGASPYSKTAGLLRKNVVPNPNAPPFQGVGGGVPPGPVTVPDYAGAERDINRTGLQLSQGGSTVSGSPPDIIPMTGFGGLR